MTLKDFKARLESDPLFATKFADVKDKKEFVEVAKAEGYRLNEGDVSELLTLIGKALARLGDI